MRKKQVERASSTIDLEGPLSTTLTPPPSRNAGVVVAFGLLLVAVVTAVGVLVVRSELGHVVQAFVGKTAPGTF